MSWVGPRSYGAFLRLSPSLAIIAVLLLSRRSNLVLPFKQRRAREVIRLPIYPALRGRRMDFPCQYGAPKAVGLHSLVLEAPDHPG